MQYPVRRAGICCPARRSAVISWRGTSPQTPAGSLRGRPSWWPSPAGAASAGPCRAERGARSTPRRSARPARPGSFCDWSFGPLFGPVILAGLVLRSLLVLLAERLLLFHGAVPPSGVTIRSASVQAQALCHRRKETAIIGQVVPGSVNVVDLTASIRRDSPRPDQTRIGRNQADETDPAAVKSASLGTVLAASPPYQSTWHVNVEAAPRNSKGHARVQDGDAQSSSGPRSQRKQAIAIALSELAGGREIPKKKAAAKKRTSRSVSLHGTEESQPCFERQECSILATDGEIGAVDDVLAGESDLKLRYLIIDTGGWLSGRRSCCPPRGSAAWSRPRRWS